jgi:hypothetical protein
VTDSRAKMRARSVVSGLVLAAPLAVAAMAGATLVAGAPTSAHHPRSTTVSCVTLLCTTTGTGGGDPKIPEFVGD